MSEIGKLKADIETYMGITTSMATEIVQLEASIDRLTEQRDRLLDALKDLESATRHFHPCLATMDKVNALIAEIEAENDQIRVD